MNDKNVLLAKVVILKQDVAEISNLPMLSKASRAELCLANAVLIIEEMVMKISSLEKNNGDK